MFSLLLFAACTSGGDTGKVVASTTGPEHCGTITEDEVWAADLNPHLVTCHVDVDGGTVTLGPGTEVRVAAAKHVSFNNADAALVVEGTRDEPVLLHADDLTAGTWNGLSFWEGAHGDIRNAELLDGGYVAYPTVPYVALQIDNSEVRVENLSIRDSVDYGFSLTNGGRFADDSSGLTSTGNGLPGYGESDVVGTAVMEGVDLTGNDEDSLVVSGGWITGEAAWEDAGVPYVVDASATVSVGNDEGGTAALRIGAGVEVRFDAGLGLGVGGYDSPGTLTVAGTEDRPVRFTSVTDDATVYWEGIRLDEASVDCSFANVEIAYGGNGYYNYGNLMLVDASPTVAGAYIHDSANWGIYCEGTCNPVLSDITYANNPEGDTN